MAVLRKEKKGNYTVVDNAIFKDKELSIKSIGLLCIMLALPDSWNYSIAGLVSIVSDGESAVRSALKELEEAGYFRREQVREGGKITKTEYIISEYKNCEKPLVENPVVENPVVENQPQVITNKVNTNKSTTNNKYIYEQEFEKLWELYPRKQGKKEACAHYVKARKNGTTSEEVEKGIVAYANYIKATNTEERYTKHGSSFFSQQAWQDEWRVRDDIQRTNNRTTNSQRRGFSSSTGRGREGTEIVGATVPRMGLRFEEEE